MNISVVIPVLNEAERLPQAIRHAWATGCDELVVADGGSDDDTVEIANQSKCLVVHSKPGRGNQLNAGAREATGDLFLFLHADTILPELACRQIRDLFSHGEFGAKAADRGGAGNPQDWVYGGFCQSIDHPGRIYRWIECGNRWRVHWQRLVYGDQAMFVSRSAFEKAGGFEDVPFLEDFVLSQRLAKLVRPVLLPGPLKVDARRWQQNGAIRQTLKNWLITLAYRLGVSPRTLVSYYRRHDL